MNAQQVKAILQMLLGTGGPVAALLLSYGVPADKLNLWVNLVVAVLPPIVAAGWAAWDNTHKKTIEAAASVPGVSAIQIDPHANGGASAAAEDPKLETVQKVGQ